jgi:hypothetical protein
MDAFITSAMEHLFSPCTRYRDIVESLGGLEYFGGPNPELPGELNLDVSTEELLSAERAFTYEDLYAMIGNEDTLAWMTPHTAVVRTYGEAVYAWNQLDDACGFRFSADGEDIVAMALSPEHLLEICDIVLRLLAVSVVHSVYIQIWSCPDGAFINAPALAYFMEHCQCLMVLTLVQLEMDENHCRVLGDNSRPGLEIVLGSCRITEAGASALAEVLGRNQGPTKLDLCYIDNLVLANGLRGNSSLKSLRPRLSYNAEDRSREVLAITGALRENKGLVDLDLTNGFRMSDETWDAVCDSLETHPTLEVLDLRGTFGDPTMAQSVLQSRIQTLVDMLKVNMSIHTIYLHARFSQHELFKESVIHYLETNRLRPRLLAIQKTLPHEYRA